MRCIRHDNEVSFGRVGRFFEESGEDAPARRRFEYKLPGPDASTGRIVHCWIVTVSLNKIIFFLSWLDREPKQDEFVATEGKPVERHGIARVKKLREVTVKCNKMFGCAIVSD